MLIGTTTKRMKEEEDTGLKRPLTLTMKSYRFNADCQLAVTALMCARIALGVVATRAFQVTTWITLGATSAASNRKISAEQQFRRYKLYSLSKRGSFVLYRG